MRALRKIRHGFTLVELIVVVMILGILGSIAAPKLLGTSQQATDQGARHTLKIIREAIETYAAQNEGELPGDDGLQGTFKNDLKPHLRGKEFPVCTVGEAKSNEVRMMDAGDTTPPGAGGTAATHSWAYNYDTGDFYINSQDVSADDVTTYDQF